MNKKLIETVLLCPNCRTSKPLKNIVFAADRGDVLTGVLSCTDCGLWYRLEGGLPEMLLPHLRDNVTQHDFIKRYHDQWDGWGVTEVDLKSTENSDIVHKLGQRNFFNADANVYEQKMLSQSFWKAFDQTFFKKIRSHCEGKKYLLEIGGGTGRVSIPLSPLFNQIYSFDLSEVMLRIAMEKARTKGIDNIFHFVADAENIPLRSEIADAAVVSGILHHVEHPDVVLEEMARLLQPGGRFVGNENNHSSFRPMFDFLMRISRLWEEEAHEDHYIISRKEITTWFGRALLKARSWTSVFVPPHFVNPLSPKWAEFILRISDRIAQRIPWLRNQGGLLLFEGEKPEEVPATKEDIKSVA